MSKCKQIKPYKQIKPLVLAILTASVATATHTSNADDNVKTGVPISEKCYGIAKKGMNDCAAYDHTCKGFSKKDGDPGEYMYVLSGTCNKIVNGKTKPE